MGQIEELEAGVLQKLENAKNNQTATTAALKSDSGLLGLANEASDLDEQQRTEPLCNPELNTFKIIPSV